MEKKKTWDDIPSLDGLGVDWEYKSETPVDKRSFIRIKNENVCGLFEVKEILVKIATAEQTHTGRLADISKGGISINLPVVLEENIPVKVGFFLGTVKVISKAVVKHTHKEGALYTTGVKFVDLDQEAADYIGGFHVATNLRGTF